MKTVFAESDFWDKNQEFVERYTEVISDTFKKAKSKLPVIPDKVTFVCQANDWECVPETGEGGFTKSSKLILLSINPKLPYRKSRLLENVESTIFHELNHSARYESAIYHETFLQNCIMEGLATVFEYENTKRRPLWGKYDEKMVRIWYEEIVSLGNSVNYNQFMYMNPDGRRWIGYNVGTWIVDEAMINSGKTIEELTLLKNEDILKLAKF